MAITVALSVLDVVTMIIVIEARRKSFPVVPADVRIAPYDVTVR